MHTLKERLADCEHIEGETGLIVLTLKERLSDCAHIEGEIV